mmetsp:Transcript_11990/g.22264  ORF Transcript_11990/g.22264 Transcript_11990/m.22264 type:complete len:339 (-) Transcript_11990:470-1486(-)|eukprot:CAMPEP_0201937136 /NCGR_PEP_ID=MMETSP0903-20130614/38845_1 /ASSEMBLY_ACC=CAM_ASM_000552 /TAXON_ID=420261 /ORGANISM="Thalassiosira antarctica, Strain CCMP982" /LENGTH=338 /DNA_ID=CAMNT_0048478011 /DNA_START=26 /DNA_END=1042 /DNA_ORIENTATION=+
MSSLRQEVVIVKKDSNHDEDVEFPKHKGPAFSLKPAPTASASDSFATLPGSAHNPETIQRRRRLNDEPYQANEPTPGPTQDHRPLSIPQHNHTTVVTTRGLRHVKRDTTREDDVEAPQHKGSPSKATNAFGAASDSASDSAHHPVFLAKMILRKVVTLLSSDEDNYDFTKPGEAFINLLKDVIIGAIWGVIIIVIMIFSDPGGYFRNVTFQSLVIDPESIVSIEESSDLKFMPIAEYEIKRKEIDDAADKMANIDEIIGTRHKDVEMTKKEMETIEHEYHKLMAHPLIGLNNYCGECPWSGDGKVSCDGRVNFLQEKHNTKLNTARINAMLHSSCKKQ